MKRATKAVITAAALPFVALPLTLGGALPTAAAAEFIPDGPATVLHHGPTPRAMRDNLEGALCEAPKVCREVYYSWIEPLGLVEVGVQENVRRLNSAINNVGTSPKIVYAFSGGARVASVWLSDHADREDAPDPDDLSFVLIGNGGRKYGGVNGWWYGDQLSTPTDTQYDIVDIAREYDPVADFPHNPFNLLALANSIAAFQYVHLSYDEADLDDPDNIVWKEGNTTYVFIPTEHLPLLQGFYNAGLGSLVEGLEPGLREAIDKAYNRTWLEGKEPQGEASTLSSTQEVSRSALTSFRVADSDEDQGGDESVGAPVDDKATSGTGGGAAGVAGDAVQDSSGDVASDPADRTDVEDTDPATAASEAAASEATGDTDDTPSADAAGGQAGEEGDGSGTSGGTAAGDTPAGGKHRAPLNDTKKVNGTEKANGTRKANGIKKAEETGTSVSGGSGTGADSSSSSSSSTGGDSDT